MRFLGIGDSCDLGALYLRLQGEGHEVKVAIANPKCRGTLAGMVEQVPDWRAALDWVGRDPADGIILFENVADNRGEVQDSLRADGYAVIGGSRFGDRLENDRAFAQGVLASIGLPICEIHDFTEVTAGLDFLDRHPGRYVLKLNGPGFSSSDNYVGVLPDGSDVRAMLAAYSRRSEGAEFGFVLMEHVEGVEMGVGAYFDGREFLTPACLDWEHKRFFPGNLGELTGEMGTVVTYDRTRTFFERTLARMAPLLRENGYLGYINLNTIVNARGIWPLEFTCRFGYPGYSILDPLQATPWSRLFARMATGRGEAFQTLPGFCVGIVLTTPPFPYTREDVEAPVGLPVLFRRTLSPTERSHLHYGEMGEAADGTLVTSGIYGWTMVVTGDGPTIDAARRGAYDLAAQVFVPNGRYRLDIGEAIAAHGYAEVERLGLLDAVEQPLEAAVLKA